MNAARVAGSSSGSSPVPERHSAASHRPECVRNTRETLQFPTFFPVTRRHQRSRDALDHVGLDCFFFKSQFSFFFSFFFVLFTG